MKFTRNPIIQECFSAIINPVYDDRGSLMELFRADDLSHTGLANIEPRMGYLSVTKPGVSRGPHEHSTQTDIFVFLEGRFAIHLWKGDKKCVLHASGHEHETLVVIVPPGVVHGYKNIGGTPGLILNFPTTLYKGWGKCGIVDEIRHENDQNSKYRID